MNRHKISNRHRPQGLRFKYVHPGVDLPCGFLDDLKAVVHPNLWVVWHPYRVETDHVMNEYTGRIDDPRFAIEAYGADEVWGWVLRNPDNSPIIENRWHIWEEHQYGYSHICPILSSDPNYLATLAKRLHRQTKIITKYGIGKYIRMLRAKEEELKEEEKKDVADLNNAVLEENSWLLNSVMENLSRGVTQATNPTKDVITSYAGQGNRSRIVTPLGDKEGGLYLPEQWRKD